LLTAFRVVLYAAFKTQVRPLRRQLGTVKAWITGQRKDQSPGTRMAVPVVEVDPVFEGVAGGPGSLIKYNPLSNMTSAEVWNFLRVMGVPTNKLHECGYISIGCEPCTRPVLPNQAEREGRWWWEDAAGGWRKIAWLCSALLFVFLLSTVEGPLVVGGCCRSACAAVGLSSGRLQHEAAMCEVYAQQLASLMDSVSGQRLVVCR
jgi:hypothetical protein